MGLRVLAELLIGSSYAAAQFQATHAGNGTGVVAVLGTRGSQPNPYTFRTDDVIAGETHCALDLRRKQKGRWRILLCIWGNADLLSPEYHDQKYYGDLINQLGQRYKDILAFNHHE